MKKLILIIASIGAFLGLSLSPIKAVVTPETITAGHVAIGALFVGGALKVIGDIGPENALNGGIALSAGLATGYISKAILGIPLAQKLAFACMAANPTVSAILAGLTVGGITMAGLFGSNFSKKSSQLWSRAGKIISWAGIICGIGAATSFLANTNGYDLCLCKPQVPPKV